MLLSFVVLALVTSLDTFASVDGLKIGAFNVRLFGIEKMKNTEVVDTLIRICQRYDILLIQEIRDVSGTAILDLLHRVNGAGPGNYNMVISDRLGRTSNKEQYAFFYRTDVGLTVTNSYHYDDGDEALSTDTFEREPFIVRFSSARTVVDDFVLVAIHTSPGDAVVELQAMDTVRESIVSKWSITDIMILGDFNADCDFFRPIHWDTVSLLTRTRTYDWLIGHDVDTTTTQTDCAYDRIVVSGPTLKASVVPNSGQVYDFVTDLGLLCTCQAEAVSDHYPVEVDLIETGARGVAAAAAPEEAGARSHLTDASLPLDEFAFRRALGTIRQAAMQAKHARGDKQAWLEVFRQTVSLVEADITDDNM